ITSELGGNYYCQARNAIGRHNSTFLSIHVTETSQIITTTAIRTAAVFLTILLLPFLWMIRKMASRKASGPGPGTVEEPVYDDIELANLTNRSAPAAQREPIEGQDEHRHYANIHHISHAENQEAPHSSDEMDEAV
ncbi:hypothetical protein CRUP_035694, partial [Coryphaenoides rupestris]